MKNFYVYMHVNKTNNKAYVGITSRVNPEYRWRKGEGYSTQSKFYRAIKKHGWENFEHVVVESNLSKAEAVRLEKQLIKQFDTIKNGYNIDEGGNTSTQSKKAIYLIDKSKNILAEFSSAEDVERELGLNAASVTECCNSPQRRLTTGGRIFCYKDNYDTFVIREKKCHPNSKQIYQVLDTGEIIATYESIQQAAKATNLSASHITACCKGTRNSVGGYFWSYVDQIDSLNIQVSNTYKYHTNSLTVYQYNLNNELINTFKSCNEAAKAINCAVSSIARCCKGERKTAAGFKWTYTMLTKE